MFKLHYANVDLRDSDIPCFEFKNHSRMVDFIDEKCINRHGEVVWLLAKEGFTDVFISESHLSIQNYLSKMACWQTTGNYFLQEYPSFEDAYRVALDMAEISPLCYN